MLMLCRISSWLGMPPPLGAASHIETITGLCKDPSIPKWYRARGEIHRQTVLLVNSVDSKLDFRIRHSLIKIYEQELDRVKDMYDDVWNDDIEIEWQGARLYLYGIAFIPPGPSMSTFHAESPAIAAKEVLLKGLAAAVGCLDTVSHMKFPYTAEGENRCNVPDHIYQLGFYPKHFFRIGAFANYYLLWFLGVDSQATEENKELARTYITFTYRLLLSFTHSPEHYRAGKSIEALARMPISAGRMSQLRVHSRLGASFMYSYSLDEGGDGKTVKGMPMLGVDTVGANGPAHPKLARAESETSPSAYTESTPHSSPPQMPDELQLQALHAQQQQQQQQASMSHAQAPLQQHGQHPQQGLPPQQIPQAQGHQQQPQHHSPGFHPPSSQPNISPQATHQQAQGMSAAPAFAMPHAPGATMPGQMFTDGQMFDPAMLASMPNPNFEYPWGEWDPSMFRELGMGLDPSQQFGSLNQMSIHEQAGGGGREGF